MGTCLQKEHQPQIDYHYSAIPYGDNNSNHSASDPHQFEQQDNDTYHETDEITPESAMSIAIDYDKLSWKKGTIVMDNEGGKFKITHMVMRNNKPATTDLIIVEYSDGNKNYKTKYRRNQLYSTQNYLQNLRKLCPNCTIAIKIRIQHESQWIPCYIKGWSYFNASRDPTNKKKFLIMFDKIEEQEICRFSHEIRCSKPLLKLRKYSHMFVFDNEINQWCYGRIKSVIQSKDKGSKWLDLNAFCVYYRKHGNIYFKYVNEFSANVAVMDNSMDNAVHRHYLISDEEIKNDNILSNQDVTHIKYTRQFINMVHWIDENIYPFIRFIIADYIGYNYGIMMHIESKTYHSAIKYRTINLTPKQSTIHNGTHTEQNGIRNGNKNIICKDCAQKPTIRPIKQIHSEIPSNLPKQIRANQFKLAVDYDIFVLNRRMWCYGKIMKVITSDNESYFKVYYRYNSKIYVKYMHQYSSGITLVNPLIHKKIISKKEVKTKEWSIYPADVSYYELLIFAYMRQHKINATNAGYIAYISDIFAKYIGCCGGLIMYIESKTKNEQMVLKTESNIHDHKLMRQCNNNDPYKSARIKAIEKLISIGRFTDAVSRCIKEDIYNLYAYILNIHSIQFVDYKQENKKNIKIINYNFHDKYSNDILYGVAEKCQSDRSRYKWCMMKRLFSAKDILDRWNIKSLPLFDNLSCTNVKKMRFILQSIMTSRIFKEIIERTKWKNIKVYPGYETKVDRLVWQLTQECFKDKVIAFYDSLKNNNIKSFELFPIVIIDNEPHTEFLYIVKLFKNNKLVDIGLSFDCDKHKKLIITGIHLNKKWIANQCQLADLDFDCKCLSSDRWTVDDIQIGNPDDYKNKLNAKTKELKQLKAKQRS